MAVLLCCHMVLTLPCLIFLNCCFKVRSAKPRRDSDFSDQSTYAEEVPIVKTEVFDQEMVHLPGPKLYDDTEATQGLNVNIVRSSQSVENHESELPPPYLKVSPMPDHRPNHNNNLMSDPAFHPGYDDRVDEAEQEELQWISPAAVKNTPKYSESEPSEHDGLLANDKMSSLTEVPDLVAVHNTAEGLLLGQSAEFVPSGAALAGSAPLDMGTLRHLNDLNDEEIEVVGLALPNLNAKDKWVYNNNANPEEVSVSHSGNDAYHIRYSVNENQIGQNDSAEVSVDPALADLTEPNANSRRSSRSSESIPDPGSSFVYTPGPASAAQQDYY